MADNTQLNSGTGGDVIATDDIAGIKHQRVKVQFGVDGSATDASETNPLPVSSVPNAAVSTDNSTATPLGISGVFTGASWEDVSNYAAISIVVNADQDSAADGLVLQYSSDGTNVDHTQLHSITAGASFTLQAMTEARYFRIVYTNGAVAQTSFRLQTIYKPNTGIGEVEQLDQPLNANSDAMLVRAVLAGLQPGGAYANVGVTTGGNIKASIEEISGGLDIGAGNAGTETQRVSIATDDVNLAAINAAVAALSKAEDAVHSSGDVGVMSLAVRADAPAPTAADGDYAPLLSDENGGLWTHNIPSHIDSNNSTTTPLGISGVFTGTGTDILGASAVAITIDSSHDSATDGMQFQFSTDNVNWDITHNFTYTAANGGRVFQLGAHTRYFRVVYTNGGTGQTHLRIQTLLMHVSPITTIHRLVDNTKPDRSATIHKSVTIAQAAGSGDFVPVQATAAGNFKVSLQELSDGVDVGAGNAGAETLRVSISTDDVNLSAIKTALEIIDDWDETDRAKVNIIAGQAGIAAGTGIDGVTVPRVSLATDVPLPAGTNAIGKLAANSGVDIGDVDVTSIIPGTGATNAGKAQDSVAGATDTGFAILAVRDDEQAVMTPADGDYTTLRTDKFGNLKVTQLPDATSAVKYGIIDAALSGDNTLQAAAGVGIKIRVLSVMMVSAGTVTARFESGASGTALTGQMNLVASSGFTLPYNPAGWFETADNALLNLELSAAISVDGCFTYVEV